MEKTINTKNKNKTVDTASKDKCFDRLECKNRINTDPDGSWTGVPADPFEKPVQDVDDL